MVHRVGGKSRLPMLVLDAPPRLLVAVLSTGPICRVLMSRMGHILILHCITISDHILPYLGAGTMLANLSHLNIWRGRLCIHYLYSVFTPFESYPVLK